MTANRDREAARLSVQRSRAKGNTHDREQTQAWSAADRRLREAHPLEWRGYYREERQRRGLTPGADLREEEP